MARARKLPLGVRMQDIFRQAAMLCRQRVAHLPKGQKGAAYRACIKETVRAATAQLEARAY